MNINEAKRLALNPQAFHKDDAFIIYSGLGVPVESQSTAIRAVSAVDILNIHEQRNGRPPTFHLKPVTK